MEGHRRLGIRVGFVVGVMLAASPPVLAEQFQCRLGQAERRIELRFADNGNRLPCEVLYWRDVAVDAEPEVLWRAESEAGFCSERTQELIARLENGGWRCTSPEETQAAAGETAEPRPPDDDRTTAAAPDPSHAPDPSGQERTDGQDAAERQQEALGQAIRRDLERLNRLTASADGRFSMNVAKLGDLDRDGIDDAAVVMTYRTGSDAAYYLLAYLSDGSTFRPAAKTYLGGSAQNLEVSEIETIDDGAIRVRFQAAGPGGPAPERRERAAFVLEDGKLVEASTS